MDADGGADFALSFSVEVDASGAWLARLASGALVVKVGPPGAAELASVHVPLAPLVLDAVAEIVDCYALRAHGASGADDASEPSADVQVSVMLVSPLIDIDEAEGCTIMRVAGAAVRALPHTLLPAGAETVADRTPAVRACVRACVWSRHTRYSLRALLIGAARRSVHVRAAAAIAGGVCAGGDRDRGRRRNRGGRR